MLCIRTTAVCVCPKLALLGRNLRAHAVNAVAVAVLLLLCSCEFMMEPIIGVSESQLTCAKHIQYTSCD